MDLFALGAATHRLRRRSEAAEQREAGGVDRPLAEWVEGGEPLQDLGPLDRGPQARRRGVILRVRERFGEFGLHRMRRAAFASDLACRAAEARALTRVARELDHRATKRC